MITRIEAENYRCFAHLAVDLDRYHVLAGANGAGKTTLLDIPVLLGDLLSAKRVADAFLRRLDSRPVRRAASLAEITHRGNGRSRMSLRIEARLPEDLVLRLANTRYTLDQDRTPTHAHYRIGLAVSEHAITVADEHLYFFLPGGPADAAGLPADRQIVINRVRQDTMFRPELDTERTSPDLLIDEQRLALADVPRDGRWFGGALWLADLLREGAVFYEPEWAALRVAAAPGDPDELLSSGRNTPWLAMTLRDEDRDRFDSWVDSARTALPQIKTIDVRERKDDNHAYFDVRYQGGYRVTSSGLSDGTLRVLAYTLLPYLPDRMLPRLLVTEEPENGIHPQAIETVLDALGSIYDSQVLLSTHSPVVLAKTDLAAVLAARIDDNGAAEVIHGDAHPRLRDWRGGLDLGTLFASGVLS